MDIDIIEVMEGMTKYSQKPYFFTCLEGRDEQKYEIKLHESGKWTYGIRNSPEMEEFSVEQVREISDMLEISYDDLYHSLIDSILTTAIYHQTMFTSIENIMGKRLVEEHMKGWEEFSTQLKNAIGEVLGPNLRIVKDE